MGLEPWQAELLGAWRWFKWAKTQCITGTAPMIALSKETLERQTYWPRLGRTMHELIEEEA